MGRSEDRKPGSQDKKNSEEKNAQKIFTTEGTEDTEFLSVFVHVCTFVVKMWQKKKRR